MANKKESLEKLEQHHQVYKNIGNIVSSFNAQLMYLGW